MIRPTLLTGVLGGRKGLVLTALLALDYDTLGTPPVNLAHLHILDLVVGVDPLYNLRHGIPLLSFP